MLFQHINKDTVPCFSVQQVVSLYYATAVNDQANDCEKFELNVTLSQGKRVNVWHSVLLPSFGVQSNLLSSFFMASPGFIPYRKDQKNQPDQIPPSSLDSF